MLRALRIAAAILVACTALPVRADEIVVSAAASLTDALQAAAADYHHAHPGATIRLNLGASGILMRQIQQGAPADIFISAGTLEMDRLDHDGLLLAGSRRDIASNRLVLVAGRGSRVRRWQDLAGGAARRIAISNPETVPSGRYAVQVLTHRGLVAAVRPKAVYGTNVRQTLAYAVNGDADAAVIFASDVLAAHGRVHVADTAAPGRDCDPIRYPAAVVRASAHSSEARRFLAFLASAHGAAVLHRFGFLPPGK